MYTRTHNTHSHTHTHTRARARPRDLCASAHSALAAGNTILLARRRNGGKRAGKRWIVPSEKQEKTHTLCMPVYCVLTGVQTRTREGAHSLHACTHARALVRIARGIVEERMRAERMKKREREREKESGRERARCLPRAGMGWKEKEELQYVYASLRAARHTELSDAE